jgi:hypothetical protein
MADGDNVRSWVEHYKRMFGHELVELGSGRSTLGPWLLVYDPIGQHEPDGHHVTGPIVMLYRENRGSGGPPAKSPLPGSLGRPRLCVDSPLSPAHVFGEVDFAFDRVNVHCDDGLIAEAVVVECAEHLLFNYYVAVVTSRVLRVIATGPDRTVSWDEDP